MTELTAGDLAPDFELPTDGDGNFSLAAMRGKSVVLYFYPKDDTPGCTTEALDFSAAIEAFDAAGAVILGVSKDTVAKHDKFKAKRELKVILGSDADSDVCERYGVWVLKKMYGREYMGIERATFLIDGEGVIRQVWRKVKVKNHVTEVLEAAKGLKG